MLPGSHYNVLNINHIKLLGLLYQWWAILIMTAGSWSDLRNTAKLIIQKIVTVISMSLILKLLMLEGMYIAWLNVFGSCIWKTINATVLTDRGKFIHSKKSDFGGETADKMTTFYEMFFGHKTKASSRITKTISRPHVLSFLCVWFSSQCAVNYIHVSSIENCTQIAPICSQSSCLLIELIYIAW